MSNDYKLMPVVPTVEIIAALGFGGDVDLAVGHGSISQGIAQNYAAALAVAPQPPALGGEPEALLNQLDDYIARINGDDRGSDGTVNELRASITPLQAEIERLKAQVSEVTTYRDNAAKKIERLRNELTGTEKERDQLKVQCDELEEAFRELQDVARECERNAGNYCGSIAALPKKSGSKKA